MLHVWGYTARWQVKDDPIAAALVSLVEHKWDRFAVRFSNAPSPFEASSTISVEHPYQVPPDAILCPEQVGKTESCSTCALCWQTQYDLERAQDQLTGKLERIAPVKQVAA